MSRRDLEEGILREFQEKLKNHGLEGDLSAFGRRAELWFEPGVCFFCDYGDNWVVKVEPEEFLSGEGAPRCPRARSMVLGYPVEAIVTSGALVLVAKAISAVQEKAVKYRADVEAWKAERRRNRELVEEELGENFGKGKQIDHHHLKRLEDGDYRLTLVNLKITREQAKAIVDLLAKK